MSRTIFSNSQKRGGGSIRKVPHPREMQRHTNEEGSAGRTLAPAGWGSRKIRTKTQIMSVETIHR